MVYLTNRPYKDSSYISQVSPGIHVLSNASLDSPWPKAQRLRNGFVELLNIHGDGELPAREMADKLMMNDTKDEEESLLTGIYTPQFEYQLSSVFVDTDSPLGRYGTRSISALTVKSDWEMSFYERHLEDKAWKDKTVTFIIEADDRS
ncbi:hypothetical protein SAY87_008573 [Trapa incisa]|uniref:Uncharacterized protein n=1 Tax=Trapa incisa TaxID=236973 RepID=A0AAN7PW03_9MYRT|nr:hypothetical protein SAY87_008573 [Trapa incisa]